MLAHPILEYFRKSTFSLGLLLFAASVTTTQSQDFDYIIEDGAVIITGYDGSEEHVVIPDTVEDLPVTRIGSRAFDLEYFSSVVIGDNVEVIESRAFNNSSIRSVEFPDGIISIEDYAFYSCNELTDVSIPNSLINLGVGAFESCTELKNVRLGENIQSIEDNTFTNCHKLTEIVIPESVISIGDSAFLNCINLLKITISESTTTIGRRAFQYCLKLGSIFIPKGVVQVEILAFSDCPALKIIEVDLLNPFFSSFDGVLYNKESTILVQYPGGKEGSYEIHEGVIMIKSSAFQGAAELTSVSIPNTVTEIEDFAFSFCSKLSSLNVSEDNSNYSSPNGVLFNKQKSILIKYPEARAATTYEVPQGVEIIKDLSFYSSENLAVIHFPESVTSIGFHVFGNCTNLTKATFPQNLNFIDRSAFNNCENLEEVYFLGDVPGSYSSLIFANSFPTIYFLPGTSGWPTSFAGRPTVLWNPSVLLNDPQFGIQGGEFGFTIIAGNEITVSVEASTGLEESSVWEVIDTITLSSGTGHFSDPDWSNYPNRFYRLTIP